MRQNTSELFGHKLAALDGDIGHVKDFYFDDQSWVIRYLVADTGSWLTGRLVLLSPHALGKMDTFEKTCHVKLTKTQIENSPPIESHRPVSRQYEVEYYRYYGWPAYWDGGGMWGYSGFPVVVPPVAAQMNVQLEPHRREDKHLRSMQSMKGYSIQAVDGTLGTVTGFLVDDKNWAVQDLIVETGHWYSGKEIAISPEKVDRISYEDSKVYVTLTQADLLHTSPLKTAERGSGNFGTGTFHD